MNILLKILAVILIIGGFVMAFKPDLISSVSKPLAGYEMIEKRVKWGVLIGSGLFLIFFQQWGNWGSTIWAFLAALIAGVIIARFLGIMLDGFYIKQLMWLLIELLIGVVFCFLYWRSNK